MYNVVAICAVIVLTCCEKDCLIIKIILNMISSITVQLSESTKQSDSSNDLIKNLQSK